MTLMRFLEFAGCGCVGLRFRHVNRFYAYFKPIGVKITTFVTTEHKNINLSGGND